MTKRNIKRISAAIVAAGISIATMNGFAVAANTPKISGAFPSVPAKSQVSITFSSYTATSAAGLALVNSFISGFEAQHPNIHVTSLPYSSSAGIAGQIQQDEVAGQTPDLVQETFNDLKFLVKDLGAVNLDQTVGTTSVQALFGGKYRYSPPVTKLGVVNGQLYGVPWTLSTPVLFYNANLFTQAGLNPAKPPTNWNEVKADALQIKNSTGSAGIANGCFGAGAAGYDWCLQAIIDSDGGSVMNKAQTKLTLDSPKTVYALSEMRDLADSGAMVNLTSAQETQAFGAGKLAMILQTSALQAGLVSADGGHFQMEASVMPGFGLHKAVPTNSGSALFIMSKDKLKQEAAWEFMQYLVSPAAETAITEQIGYPPLRPSIAGAPQYLESWANANQFLTPNLFELEHITPWLAYPGPNYSAITTMVLNAAANIIFQDANASATMKSTQSQAASLLK